MQKIFRKEAVLFIIILLTITSRLYRFNEPIADWHSWRQVDTSAVSRNFILQGYDLLHPRFDDISNVPSGKDNPEGYRFVEFPLYNLTQALGYETLGVFSLEQWGRIVSIIASVGTTIFLYFLAKEHANIGVGLLAATFYAILPFNLFYGRTILPDPSMTMAVFGGIYFFDRWLASENKKGAAISYGVALLFTVAALLLKPYALFFLLPMAVLAWGKFRFRAIISLPLWIFVFVSIAPLILWRLWMNQYPEGVPVNAWLFNEGNIRFTGAYFYWLFAERIGKLILGYWGIALFVLGMLTTAKLPQKDKLFFFSFLISSLLYMTIIARGNVQHDYYQISIVPSIVFFVALGAYELIHTTMYGKILPKMLCIILALAMCMFSWYHVREFFNINNRSILIAGEAVDALTPKQAKVIAPYNGDTTLLYYTKRKGWANFQHSLPEMKKIGADYLLLVNPTEKDEEIGKIYQIISQRQEYILFRLH